MIHLDARVEGVDVPPSFKEDPHLRLNLSRRFGRPLVIHEDRVEATLTFGGRTYPCVVPFAAIFGMISHETGKTLMWPEDIPPEVLEELEKAARTPPSSPRAKPVSKPPPSKPSRPRLAPVPCGPELDGEDGAKSSEPEPPRTPPKRGHLRLVK